MELRKEDTTLLDALERSLPRQSTSFIVQRKRIWLAGFRASPPSSFS
jgi:hypothetical protein